MALSDFLAGRPTARPNVGLPPRWRIEFRHAEGGPWFPVTAADDREIATEEAESLREGVTPGDLVRIRESHYGHIGLPSPSDLPRPSAEGPVYSTYVVGPRGPALVLPVQCVWAAENDWVEAWERPGRGPFELLAAAAQAPVSDRLLVLGAAPLFPPFYPLVPDLSPLVRDLVEAARTWALQGGARAPEALFEAMRTLQGEVRLVAERLMASPATVNSPERLLAGAAWRLAAFATTAGPLAWEVEALRGAMLGAWQALPPDADEAKQAMGQDLVALAPLVRAAMPLSEVLLAFAGVPGSRR